MAEQLYEKLPYCHSGHRIVPSLSWLSDILRAAIHHTAREDAAIVQTAINPEISDDYEKGLRLWLATAILKAHGLDE